MRSAIDIQEFQGGYNHTWIRGRISKINNIKILGNDTYTSRLFCIREHILGYGDVFLKLNNIKILVQDASTLNFFCFYWIVWDEY